MTSYQVETFGQPLAQKLRERICEISILANSCRAEMAAWP